jgi:hypothetical protein
MYHTALADAKAVWVRKGYGNGYEYNNLVESG